jgi:hypothetical protein
MTQAQIKFLKDFIKHYNVLSIRYPRGNKMIDRGVRPEMKDKLLNKGEERYHTPCYIYVQICAKSTGLPIYCAYIREYEPTICLKAHGSEFYSDGIMDFHFDTREEARETFREIFGL